jgi:hypothetical protein
MWLLRPVLPGRSQASGRDVCVCVRARVHVCVCVFISNMYISNMYNTETQTVVPSDRGPLRAVAIWLLPPCPTYANVHS